MYETSKPVVEDTTSVVNEPQVVDKKPKKKFKWGKLVGFIFLGLFLAGAGYLGYRFYMFKAYRVFVSNVTSRSGTISWITDTAESGMVLVKEDGNFLPIRVSPFGVKGGYDDIDYSIAELEMADKTQENIIEAEAITSEQIESEIFVNGLGCFWAHHVTVRDLKPNTEYEFIIGDGLIFEKVSSEDTGISGFTTTTEPESISTPIPAYGVVRYYDTERELYIRAVDAIVYVDLVENLSGITAERLSSTTNMEGGWYVDLSSAEIDTGESFWNIVKEEEAMEVSLNLTIESVGFGRWTRSVKFEESAPTDIIEINLDEIEEEDGLKYEGMSIASTNGINLINNVFARPVVDSGDGYIVVANTRKTSTGSYKTHSYSVIGNSHKATNIKTSLKTNNLTPGTVKKNTTPVSVPSIEDIIKKAPDKKPESGEDAGGGGEEKESGPAKGGCGDYDVCEPKEGKDNRVQCGYLNSANCNCTCGSTTVAVQYGGYCSCIGGKPVVEKRPTTITKPLDESFDDSGGNRCPNDNGDGENKCLSSMGCWYSAGYRSRMTYDDKGHSCVATSGGKGRWASTDSVGEIDVDYDIKEGEYLPTPAELATAAQKKAETEAAQEAEDELNKMYSLAESLEKALGEGRTFEEYYKDLAEAQKLIHPEAGNVGPMSEKAKVSCRKVGMMGMWGVSDEGDAIKCVFGTWRVREYKDTDKLEEGKECLPLGTTLYRKGRFYKCGGKVAEDKTYQWEETSDLKAEGVATTFEHNWSKQKGLCPADTCSCLYTEGGSGGFTIKTEFVDKGQSCTKSFSESSLYRKDITQVFAADDSAPENTQFVYDPTTEMFSGFTAGVYSFEHNGDTYLIEVSDLEYLVSGGEIALYVDLNNDGDIDKETEKISDNTTLLNVQTLAQIYTYRLKEGFNFVSFPFMFNNPNISMASDLLVDLNTSYGNIFLSISKYDSGKWKIVGSNAGDYNQNDFQILPGQGYVLKVKSDATVIIYGNEVTYDSTTDSAPIRFMPGWNLVGLYGTSVRSYTAESLLQDITNYEPVDFTAVNVSRWQENRALYEALQRDEDATVYGLDFPIELKRSYFVKVTKGDGNWEPGIR